MQTIAFSPSVMAQDSEDPNKTLDLSRKSGTTKVIPTRNHQQSQDYTRHNIQQTEMGLRDMSYG